MYYAFDLATGEVRWSHDFKPELGHATFHGDPLLTDSVLVTPTEALQPVHTRAFDPRTGATLWQRSGEWALTRSDVLGAGELAVGRNDRGELVALDLWTGEPRWHVSHRGRRFTPDVAESPALEGNRVFFSAPDGAVYGVDPTGGAVTWRTELECDVTTSVSVADGEVYAGCRDGRIFRLAGEDGRELGRIRVPGRPDGRLAVLDDHVVVPGGRRWIGAVGRSLDRVLWSYVPESPLSVVQPLAWNGLILTGDGEGTLIGLDAGDGSVAWKARLSGTIRGLGYHEGIMLVGTVEGVLYAVDAGTLGPGRVP